MVYRRLLELSPRRVVFSDRERKQVWSEKAVDLLFHDRTMADPVPFKNIARTLNRMYRANQVDGPREFTAKDCQNKWQSMFPSAQDAVATNNYLHHLAEIWPGLKFHVQRIRSGGDVNISAVHIVWPWAKTCMESLHNSIFCDATHLCTCYGYKVVMFTTLDGNKQHRPLMCSFILYGHAKQWTFIFNFFAKCG